MQPADRPPTEAPLDKPVMLPWFEDCGHEGTWLEHLTFSSWLVGEDGALFNRAFAAARNIPSHDLTNTADAESASSGNGDNNSLIERY